MQLRHERRAAHAKNPKAARHNPLLRFLATHMAIGVGFSALFTAALVFGGVTDFGKLVANDPAGLLAAALLFLALSITWGSAAMGTAIFLLPKEKDPEDDGGRPRWTDELRLQPRPARRATVTVKPR